jgi:hypothetical protein
LTTAAATAAAAAGNIRGAGPLLGAFVKLSTGGEQLNTGDRLLDSSGDRTEKKGKYPGRVTLLLLLLYYITHKSVTAQRNPLQRWEEHARTHVTLCYTHFKLYYIDSPLHCLSFSLLHFTTEKKVTLANGCWFFNQQNV